jgi:predicted glycosyltransferase involved in capsule biosynthesis
MKLSLIIAYTYSKDENRLEGLRALMQSIKSQTYKNFETIVVEDTQGRKESSFPFGNEVNKVITITDPEHRKFNKSWIMNVGAREAATDNLLFIDSEISFGLDFLQKVIEFAQNKQFFNCWSEYICMVGRDNPNERRHFFPKTIRAMIGIFFSKRDFFFNVLGGYNENYFGYGGEDNDIFHRAKFIFENNNIKYEENFWERFETTIPVMNYTIYHHYHHWHPPEGPNPLCPNREDILINTFKNTQKIIDKLIKTNIGNLKCPTLI